MVRIVQRSQALEKGSSSKSMAPGLDGVCWSLSFLHHPDPVLLGVVLPNHLAAALHLWFTHFIPRQGHTDHNRLLEVAAPPALSCVGDTKALLKAATKPMGTVLQGKPHGCLLLILSSHGYCHLNSRNCPLKQPLQGCPFSNRMGKSCCM